MTTLFIIDDLVAHVTAGVCLVPYVQARVRMADHRRRSDPPPPDPDFVVGKMEFTKRGFWTPCFGFQTPPPSLPLF